MNLHANPMEQHVNGQGVTKNPAFNQKDLNTADGKVSNAGQDNN
jgi:hypothetical protein